MSFVKRLFEPQKMPKLNPIIIQQGAPGPVEAAPAAASTPTQASAGISTGGAMQAFGRGALISAGKTGGLLSKKAQGIKRSLLGGV